MDKALFIAMTGAKHNMLAQTARSNNLANVNTTGFRADFEQARAMPVFGQHHPSRVYALTERPATDIQNGSYDYTGNPLDIAVQGEGWIAVQAPNGEEAYTRRGDLNIDPNGVLRTGNGLPVIGNGGPIVLPPGVHFHINGDGGISVANQGADAAVVDQIKLVSPQAMGLTMEKGLDGLMRPRNFDEPLPFDEFVRVESGALETSNVNAVNELTSILALSRQYEMNVKMMKSVDENSSRVNTLLRMS
ncbi:flagellar basal body rod protein FlgF [Marinospirillum alkaliphilum]|uniref:Flagellar basal-body rod protein FlgF n=1 Tax=Marinospirillum alkaliphilum DSM 21637 TaxID=1122209 RepID=A0A1K1UZH3_9GAMM|nr:flagellar basal body rod protein FlgF [Marinospirillum alkaliphilum]SFX18258.1 flagellar basal-body rod protein FlgF [Marinospirillum alkaliphilum DSM 21637]